MSSIVRLYMFANDNGLDAELIGSVCLLWHRGNRYLVTAGHVAGQHLDRTKYVGATSELISVDGFRFNTRQGLRLQTTRSTLRSLV